MSEWRDIADALADVPSHVDIIARYKSGVETVGCFYQTDIETIWHDKDDRRSEEAADEWPVEWKPMQERSSAVQH